MEHSISPTAPTRRRRRQQRQEGGRRRLPLIIQLLYTTLQVLLATTTTRGQRIKKGCYDANPSAFNCDTISWEPEPLGDAMDFIAVEETCYYFATVLFPIEEDIAERSAGEEYFKDYINAVESDTELCHNLTQAFHRCIFCFPDDMIVLWECEGQSGTSICDGRKPQTVAEILSSEEYPQFTIQEDIDETCLELQKIYNHERDDWLPEWQVWFSMPASKDLCQRQSAVGHLCPGRCDGTCFDPLVNPPSCNATDYKGLFNETLDSLSVCTDLQFQMFYLADDEANLNVSGHSNWFRHIHLEDDICEPARQAYSSCVWCAAEFCWPRNEPLQCNATLYDTPAIMYNPDVDVDVVCEALYRSYLGGGINTLEIVLNSSQPATNMVVEANTTLCQQAKQTYHQCFWCAQDVPDDFCGYGFECEEETLVNVTIPDGFVSRVVLELGLDQEEDSLEEHCDEIYEYYNASFPEPWTQHSCYEQVYLAQLCTPQFCPNGFDAKEINPDYLGASTKSQRLALIWMSRVSAFLSFCGASYILWDTLSKPKLRRNVYYQLLIGMAVFDIVTALAWVFATTPINEEEAVYVQGAQGNAASCKAQAFFIQLGQTSIFYNVSLAAYYVLVIAHDWREFRLRKIRVYLHAIPLMVGFGLAFGGLSSYHWIEYSCHILPPPEGDLWRILVFVVLPLGFSIALITVAMLMVYCKVRNQAAAGRKWTLGVGQANTLEKAVFWQCFFYVLAFYITWPIMFSVYLASVDVNGPFPLTMTIAFVAPLQGFNNALVYLRPKIWKHKVGQIVDTTNLSSFRSTFANMMQYSKRFSSMASSVGTNLSKKSSAAALSLGSLGSLGSLHSRCSSHHSKGKKRNSKKSQQRNSKNSQRRSGSARAAAAAAATANNSAYAGFEDMDPSALYALHDLTVATESALQGSMKGSRSTRGGKRRSSSALGASSSRRRSKGWSVQDLMDSDDDEHDDESRSDDESVGPHEVVNGMSQCSASDLSLGSDLDDLDDMESVMDDTDPAPNDELSVMEQAQAEEDAGTILIGFLSTLRDSYEDAVRKKATTGPAVATVKNPSESTAKKPKKRPRQEEKRPRQEGESSSKIQKVQEAPTTSNSSSASRQVEAEDDNDAKPKATPVKKKTTVKQPEVETDNDLIDSKQVLTPSLFEVLDSVDDSGPILAPRPRETEADKRKCQEGEPEFSYVNGSLLSVVPEGESAQCIQPKMEDAEESEQCIQPEMEDTEEQIGAVDTGACASHDHVKTND